MILTPTRRSKVFLRNMEDEKDEPTDPVTIERLRKFAATLNGYGIDTLEDLRLSICKDVKTGIETVTCRTKTSQALLMALLITEATDDAARKGKRRLIHYWSGFKSFRSVYSLSKTEVLEIWNTKGASHWRETREPLGILFRRWFAGPKRFFINWRTHWLDALIIVLPLTLGLLLIFQTNPLNKHRLQYVTTTVPVPAFHKISDQVEIKNSPIERTAFTTVPEVRDRYTLADIPAGAPLQSKQLLSTELSAKMQGRKILSVPIKASNYTPTLIVPNEVILVLSPRNRDSTATSSATFDVIVLRIEGSGETRSAIVALQDHQFDSAAPLLGSHEAFLTDSIPKMP